MSSICGEVTKNGFHSQENSPANFAWALIGLCSLPQARNFLSCLEFIIYGYYLDWMLQVQTSKCTNFGIHDACTTVLVKLHFHTPSTKLHTSSTITSVRAHLLGAKCSLPLTFKAFHKYYKAWHVQIRDYPTEMATMHLETMEGTLNKYEEKI